MTETVITVQGTFSAHYPPERARVRLEIGFEAADRDEAFTSATDAAGAIRDALTSRHDAVDGPVTAWNSDTLRVWSSRPWNDQGVQLPLVHHAAVSVRATFSDFAELSRFLELAATSDGVQVDGVTWELTEARRNAVLTEVRSRAVKDAMTKATVYAQSIGLGTVRAVAIADPGMLGDSGAAVSFGQRADMAMMRVGGSPELELELKPEDIQVEASVDARFVAS